MNNHNSIRNPFSWHRKSSDGHLVPKGLIEIESSRCSGSHEACSINQAWRVDGLAIAYQR